jgi:hypothetical protein
MARFGTPTPTLPRYAGERAVRAHDPSPAKRGRVAARSADGWGFGRRIP